MSVRSEILNQFDLVAQEQDKRLASPLSDDTPLLESGLDSLCFAIVVVRIADALGVDPFSDSEDAHLPVTVGEFIKFYENAAN
jgi:acyl carrier protein